MSRAGVKLALAAWCFPEDGAGPSVGGDADSECHCLEQHEGVSHAYAWIPMRASYIPALMPYFSNRSRTNLSNSSLDEKNMSPLENGTMPASSQVTG